MLVLLVGPKGSGKTHIGRLLEQRLQVYFFPVERCWMAYHAECAATHSVPTIEGGLSRVLPELMDACRGHAHVCVETTGASRQIIEAMLGLLPRAEIIAIRLRTPIAVCRDRIARRDPADQVPMDDEAIRAMHELSEALELDADLDLPGIDGDDARVVDYVARRVGTHGGTEGSC